MKAEQYEEIYDCLNQLKQGLSTNTDATVPISCDIIKATAEKVNNCQIDVYDIDQVDWGKVTLFDMGNVQRLLNLINTQFLDDVGEAISIGIDGLYYPDFFNIPTVSSPYYTETITLPRQNDWYYETTINTFIERIKTRRAKSDAYKKKLEANKKADAFLYQTAEVLVSKLNEDPDFTNKMVIISKKEYSELKKTKTDYDDAKEKTSKLEAKIKELKAYIDSQPTNDRNSCFSGFVIEYLNANCNKNISTRKSVRSNINDMISCLGLHLPADVQKQLTAFDDENKEPQKIVYNFNGTIHNNGTISGNVNK